MGGLRALGANLSYIFGGEIMSGKIKGLSCFTLVMLIAGSIDSIRNLPATALFGSQLIFFFIFSAIVFLIPTALIAAELASMSDERSGIYQWVKSALGINTAAITIWLQWINTLIWFPTILSFIAGTAAYLIAPNLINDKSYLVTVILIVFWGLTFLNLAGIRTSAKFASICGVVGMIFPMALIIILAFVWLALGKPLQIHFTAHSMLPQFNNTQDWISLTAIMTAFLGMELTAVHINDIEQPQKTFPRAMFYSVILILITMIMGSLAIAFVLPKAQINLVAGTVEAFEKFLLAYHLQWFTPIIVAMILFGTLGSIINWLISPAKGLLQSAEDGFLPKYFSRVNKNGVPSRILLAQAIIVSIVCVAFTVMPSVNGSYWLLTDLSTQVYMLMYVLLFVAGMIIKTKFFDHARGFVIPYQKPGFFTVAILGLIGCFITLYVGFFPPSGINVGGVRHYEIVFSSGLLLMILPGFGLLVYKALKNFAMHKAFQALNSNENSV